jgi:quaternary ammonium compound-resistance protein SugE
MAWFYLFAAGVFEIGWAIGLKYAAGFSRPGPAVLTVLSMVISLGFLGLSLKTLPLSTAYAIWTGIGTVGTVGAGLLIFGETITVSRLVCIALIVLGLVGLKILSPD